MFNFKRNAAASPISKKEICKHFVNKDLQNINFCIYKTTDSTNTRAKIYADEHPDTAFAVFIAEHQSAGRGRMGRSFDSEDGQGLYISILSRKEEYKPGEALPTVRAALDTSVAIEKVSGVNLKIKWVNDIIANGRKLAGILTEGKADAGGSGCEYSITGIGINLYKREFPKEISDIAISLEDVCGRKIPRAELAAALIEEFFKEKDILDVLREYREKSSVLGERITVSRLNGECFDATAESILENGALLVKRDNGTREELISAEVSIKCRSLSKSECVEKT